MEELRQIEIGSPVEIFVYGTLMKGESNHHLMGDAEFLGEDAIADAELFDLGGYPMFVSGTGIVYGERYRIPLTTLPLLDELEQHPHYYRRRWVTLQSSITALIYEGFAKHTQGYPRILSGRWRWRNMKN